MSVSLNAFDSVLILKLVLFLHDFEYLVVIWHLLLAWEETGNAFFLIYFEPGVRTNLLNR